MKQLVEVLLLLLSGLVLAARVDAADVTYEPTEEGFTISFQGEVVGHFAGLGERAGEEEGKKEQKRSLQIHIHLRYIQIKYTC